MVIFAAYKFFVGIGLRVVFILEAEINIGIFVLYGVDIYFIST